MKVSSQNNISYKAQLLSQWRCSNIKNKAKNISVIAIEKKDLPFIENFITYIKNLNNDAVKKEIMKDSSKTMLEILIKSNMSGMDKVKMYIAAHDRIPCGILIANIPKIFWGDEVFVYSSRHNPSKNETEIDWLVTWNPDDENIKGIGKALVGEYFRTIKKDKFRDVFVRSEVPEKSFANAFYEKLGFEQLGKKRLRLFNKNSAQYVIHDFTENDDETIPMLITRSHLLQTAENLAKNMGRQEFKKNSTDIDELISI